MALLEPPETMGAEETMNTETMTMNAETMNVANRWKRKENESKAGRPRYRLALVHFGLHATSSLLR
eukprot:1151004-Amphidinium_carterae.1